MIERDEDQRQITCDGCGAESHVVDQEDFQSLIDDLKSDKWKIRNLDGRWTHHCANCDPDESRVEKARRKFGLTSG